MGMIYSLFSEASGVNRIIGSINKSYLDRALKVYQSSKPPDPEVLKKLIDDYDVANDEDSTSMTSSFDKVKMMRGPDKRDNSLVLLAKIIYEQKNEGAYDDIAKMLDEDSFRGESGNVFWVFLFKKAALKYSGYFTATALNEITNEVTGAPDEKYKKQIAAVNAKLHDDFFSDAPDGPKFSEFKTAYVKYRDSKKFSGGKNMRGRRGTHKSRQHKRARKSIRK